MYKIKSVEDIELLFFSEIFMNKNSELDEMSNKFAKYVQFKLNNQLTDFHWSKIIRLYSGSEFHSVELFIKLYSEFLEV